MKTLIMVMMLCVVLCGVCYSEDLIGEVKTNGMFVKDTIRILAFDDPNIKGVSCYITYYERSLSFVDSGRSSISCRRTGVISGNMGEAKNIFKMSKGWFKETIVDRFYDAKRNALVYISYQDSTDSKKSYHQVSVVPVKE